MLVEAIARARREGRLRAVREVAEAPGFRRRLRGRIAAWTRAGLDPEGEPPRGGAVAAEEWAIFGLYHEMMSRLGAKDPEAFAVWASKTLRRDPPPDLHRFGLVMVIEPTALDRSTWRALEHFHERSDVMGITLPCEDESARTEIFASVIEPLCAQFEEWGFRRVWMSEDRSRPAGLAGIGRELFRDDTQGRPRLERAEGLVVLGAPRGEGVALVLARRIRDLLATGTDPDEILILFRQRNEQAALVLETLRAWGLPATGFSVGALVTEPAVAALLGAMRVPVEGWEAERVIRLLRSGQVRPDWPEARAPLALPRAASAIRATRVFRGREAIREALRRASSAETRPLGEDAIRQKRRAEAARVALDIFDRLAGLIEAVDRPGTWSEQVGRLEELADGLGMDLESVPLETLRTALDDQGMVLEGLGLGDRPWSWAAFVGEAERLVRDLPRPEEAGRSGAVRLAMIDETEGVGVAHVLLAALEEGTFPAREALEPDPMTGQEGGIGADGLATPAFAGEMLRFLRVVGMARSTLTLVYPTTDEKGQDLLAASFLDDVKRLFMPEAWRGCLATIRRLDPVVTADLAGSPAEARIRAIALACETGQAEELGQLARSPAHRAALEGTAAALRVAHYRLRSKDFGIYEGCLRHPAAIRRIAEEFGPGRPAFSPSQLESLAFCPFQFYLRYVLRLEPVDDRDELEDDYAGRGSLIHRALETLHTRLRDTPPDETETLAERIAAGIEETIAALRDGQGPPGSDVDAGLQRIEGERLLRIGRRYARQFADYLGGEGACAECHRFEVLFGKPGASEYPPLVLGREADAVQLQGMIDRIDLIRRPDRMLFRVIDYKSGSCPSPKDIASGVALQLPLYALAVERLILADFHATPLDVGYWTLGKNGFRPARRMAKIGRDGEISEEGWDDFRRRLEEFVVALVGRLRAAAFPIAPRSEDCTRSCDYRSVCRISQVRAVGKVWGDAPRLEAAP
ncbi:MAG: PD-(D/E)XK nuclease family protein [Isosphaeraceae bacterium]|nr:PD-(D/E)XK nuclease family protein [Isosphaeraceae bacterium]